VNAQLGVLEIGLVAAKETDDAQHGGEGHAGAIGFDHLVIEKACLARRRMHHVAVQVLLAGVHAGLVSIWCGSAVENEAIAALLEFPGQTVQANRAAEGRSVAHVHVICDAGQSHANRSVHVGLAHVRTEQVRLVAQRVEQGGKERIVGVTGPAQVAMLDAIQEFGERGHAAGALAAQQQQFGHVLKRDAAQMAVYDFVQRRLVQDLRCANTQESQVSL